jgi:hypothetical protein
VLPDLYQRCLSWVESRDRLKPSSFVKAQLAEIIALEEELRAALPSQYEEHLLRVGVGVEHGGLAFWFHLDRTRAGNIIDCNQALRDDQMAPCPRDFLAVYDSLEGEYFGFRRKKNHYSSEVYCWCPEEARLARFSPDLATFYQERIDLEPPEIEQLEKGTLVTGSSSVAS